MRGGVRVRRGRRAESSVEVRGLGAGVAAAGRRGRVAAAAGAAAHGAAGAAVDAAPRARAAAAVPLPGARRGGRARGAQRRHLPLHAEAAAGLGAQPARLHGLHLGEDRRRRPREYTYSRISVPGHLRVFPPLMITVVKLEHANKVIQSSNSRLTYLV